MISRGHSFLSKEKFGIIDQKTVFSDPLGGRDSRGICFVLRGLVVEYYAFLTNIDGDCFKTRTKKSFKEFERVVELYRRSNDLVKGESFKRYPNGKSERIGTFWKRKENAKGE